MTSLFVLYISFIFALAPYCLLAAEGHRGGREFKLEELSYTDVEKLDRQKTIFLLTFGIMEEHGPVMPIGTDWFGNLAIRDQLSQHLRATFPDYDVRNTSICHPSSVWCISDSTKRGLALINVDRSVAGLDQCVCRRAWHGVLGLFEASENANRLLELRV
jgi:hypothetical protein